MEGYRDSLLTKIKMYRMISSLSCLIILIPAVFSLQIWSQTNDFIHGFQLGIFIALQFIFLLKSKKLRMVLNNPEQLKLLYIETKDERKRMIDQKSNSTGFYIIMTGISVASVISGFFSTTIFFTLIITLFFILIIKVLSKYFYNKKY